MSNSYENGLEGSLSANSGTGDPDLGGAQIRQGVDKERPVAPPEGPQFVGYYVVFHGEEGGNKVTGGLPFWQVALYVDRNVGQVSFRWNDDGHGIVVDVPKGYGQDKLERFLRAIPKGPHNPTGEPGVVKKSP